MHAKDVTTEFYAVNGRSMKVYLAGPMRGKMLHNVSQFLLGEAWLESQGFEVLSPARKDIEAGFDFTKSLEEQPQFSMAAAFTWDFAAVLRSDGIVILDHWEESKGATAERLVAHLCGKPVYRLSIVPPRVPDPIQFWDDSANWHPDVVRQRRATATVTPIGGGPMSRIL